jgi:hypothetical protein
VARRAGLDMCGKSRPPPGFDPQTVQPVASRYTYYATRPTTAVQTTVEMTSCSVSIAFIILLTHLAAVINTRAIIVSRNFCAQFVLRI